MYVTSTRHISAFGSMCPVAVIGLKLSGIVQILRILALMISDVGQFPSCNFSLEFDSTWEPV